MKPTTADKGPDRSAEMMEALATRFAEMIESGIADPAAWRKSWRSVSGASPWNVSTKNRYSGGNSLLLSFTSILNGWGNDWSTFNGWKNLGAMVRKGEKSQAFVLIPKPVITKAERAAAAAEGRSPRVGFMKFDAVAVFNAAQVDGWSAPGAAELVAPDVSAVSAFIASTGADVRHGGDRAFYAAEADYVQLPSPEQFSETAAYAATVFHELAHWTGHASRLNRLAKNRFGDEGYAFEELVAELTAAHLSVEMGFEAEPSVNHGSYLAGWLNAIRSNPKALWTAASLAAKAADFLISPSAACEVDGDLSTAVAA